MSDVGMCGDYDSVIGVKKDTPIRRFFGKVGGERMSPAEGEATVCGCFVATDDATGKAVSIVSIRTGGILGT